MFNPSGMRLKQWSEIHTNYAAPDETGFVENWANTIDLTTKRFLPLSSSYGVAGDYSDFTGSNRVQDRTRQLQKYIADGIIPQGIKDQNSQRMRGGSKTNWNEISKWANENLKGDIDHITTDEEFETHRNQVIAETTRRVEEIQSRATGWGYLGQFAGSMNAMAVDPITLVTLPLSAPAVGVARTSRAAYTAAMSWRVAALNMGIQVPMEVMIYDWNEEIGADYTLADALINIGATGVLSGTIGGIAANLGHKYSGNIRGEFGDFLSKDRDSLYESFKKLGLKDDEAEALASYQHEINNAIYDPELEIAKDLISTKEQNPEIVHTAEETAIVNKRKAEIKAETKLKEIEEIAVIKKEVDVIKKKIATAKKPKKVVTKKPIDETTGEKKLRQAQNKINATEKKLVASEKKLATAQKKFDDATEDTDQKNVTGKLLTRASAETEKARTLAEKAKENFTDVEAEVSATKKAPVEEDNKATIDDAKEKVDWEFVEDHSEITGAQKAGLITKKQEGLLLDEYFKKEGDIEKTIKAKVEADSEPEVQNTKDFVEDLENRQEDLNSRGQEIGDEEPIYNLDEEELLDAKYDDVSDDLTYYNSDGEPIRAKGLVDEYDEEGTELIETLVCLDG